MNGKASGADTVGRSVKSTMLDRWQSGRPRERHFSTVADGAPARTMGRWASRRVGISTQQRSPLARRVWDARYLYLLILPGLIYLIIFAYGPMYGLQLAFKRFNAGLGIFRSEWIGLAHFERLLTTPNFAQAFRNTLIISFGRIITGFPLPILLAIALNELRGRVSKRVLQTVFTFPHFLSWVIVSGILITFLGSQGPANALIERLGGESISFLGTPRIFRPLLYVTAIWKQAGWASIIYLASMAGIDPQLYEAAYIDGASRVQSIWHITLPGIRETIIVLFVLTVGQIMNAGFDQIFNLQNAAVRAVSEILDTYVYHITFEAVPDFGFSTAVGLFKAVINLILLFAADKLAKAVSGTGLFA